MRLRTLVPATLSAAALLVLPACGGSSDDTGSAATSSSSSAAATTESSAAADDSEFCQQAQAALDANNQAVTDAQSDPSQLSSILTQATDQLEAVTPPDAIASDWQTLVDAGRQLAEATAGVDLTTPEGQQQVAGTLQEIGTTVEPASANVQSYLSENCGIATTPTATS
jgi:thioesterase domain-containing protein